MQTQRKQKPHIRLEEMDYEDLIDLRTKIDKEIRARQKAMSTYILSLPAIKSRRNPTI